MALPPSLRHCMSLYVSVVNLSGISCNIISHHIGSPSNIISYQSKEIAFMINCIKAFSFFLFFSEIFFDGLCQ